MGAKAAVAKAEVCDSRACELGHLLVRGDRIEFVSTEQVRAVGRHPLNADAMPSDIVLPPSYVLVQDTTGLLLDRCNFFIVRWRGRRRKLSSDVQPEELQAATEYFGHDRIQEGDVDIPTGDWSSMRDNEGKRLKIAFIRYRRHGYDKPFEHPYEPAVHLYENTRVDAWRLVLPDGCHVDSRGFVRP